MLLLNDVIPDIKCAPISSSAETSASNGVNPTTDDDCWALDVQEWDFVVMSIWPNLFKFQWTYYGSFSIMSSNGTTISTLCIHCGRHDTQHCTSNTQWRLSDEPCNFQLKSACTQCASKVTWQMYTRIRAQSATIFHQTMLLRQLVLICTTNLVETSRKPYPNLFNPRQFSSFIQFPLYPILLSTEIKLPWCSPYHAPLILLVQLLMVERQTWPSMLSDSHCSAPRSMNLLYPSLICIRIPHRFTSGGGWVTGSAWLFARWFLVHWFNMSHWKQYRDQYMSSLCRTILVMDL